MAITVTTQAPDALLQNIKKAIKEKRVDTWECDTDGDFTHCPEQWYKKAWLRPSSGIGVLTFSLLGPQNRKVEKAIYGVYHGRFIEMLLTHFSDQFSRASASAKKEGSDNFDPA